MYPDLRQLLEWISIDGSRVETGRQRQESIWHGEKPDRVPILLGRSESRQLIDRVGPQHMRLCEHQLRGGRPVEEYYGYDHYTLQEQFHDPEKMLIESLWDIIGWSRASSDAQLALRPNYGVGIVASVFGCTTSMGEHDMPWVASRPGKEELLNVDLDSLCEAGLIPRVIEFIQLARETLQPVPELHVYMPDLQGPMNTMFLLRQQDAFFDMRDDEVYYRKMMDLICDVYIRLTTLLKQELGEPLDGGYHGALYMSGGGVRVVDDVSIMLSPEMYEDFSLSYLRRCLEPFGGGWVHSCGDINHLLPLYLRADEIRGINFGEPEYYNFEQVLPQLAEHQVFCYGGPVRNQDETTEAYLSRAARCLREAPASLIFQPRIKGKEMQEGDWPAPEAIVEMWHRFCESTT